MARKAKASKKRTDERLIDWRNGRAYADFRSYQDVGGGRMALAEPGKSWGTTDPDIAEVLYDALLDELKAKRRGKVGIYGRATITLAQLAQHHLVMKAQAGRTSDSHMFDLESRLRAAIEHFGEYRDPRTIEPKDVREWGVVLAKGGKRKPGTVRHYLNALSGLYRRAREGGYAEHNPVADLVEKPTGTATREEATFYSVAEASLLLEAARVLDANGSTVGTDGNRAAGTHGLYPIIATLLLTGGRWSEVAGLDVDDVSFDRKLVRFRPNAHRRLKTRTSQRSVPLWPQLEEVLRAWIFGGAQPRTSGLLFPSLTGGIVKDIRKSLDAMAELCGMDAGDVRTRAFRHTYCSARLQTVERIVRPGMDPSEQGAWDYVEVTRDRVAREMGHGGTGLVARIYGHAPRLPYRSEEVAYRIELHRDELESRLPFLLAQEQ